MVGLGLSIGAVPVERYTAAASREAAIVGASRRSGSPTVAHSGSPEQTWFPC